MNKTIYTMLILLCGLSVKAQLSDTASTTYERVISVDTADRIFQRTKLDEQPEVKVTEQTFDVQDHKLRQTKIDPKIFIYPIKPTPLARLSNSYVRAGFGNYITPYLEGYYNSGRKKDMSYGGHLLHRSSARGPVMEDLSRSSVNQVDGFFDLYRGNLTIGGDVDYSRRRYNFYGFGNDLADSIAIPIADSIKQTLNDIKLTAKLASRSKSVSYDVGLGFDYLQSFESVSEAQARLKGTGWYALGTSKVKVDVEGYMSQYKDDTSSQSRNYAKILPHYYFEREWFKFDWGVNMTLANDTGVNTKTVHLYPALFLDVRLEKPHGYWAYAGLSGGLERNSYRSLVYENPFLGQNQQIKNSNNTLHFFGGLRGTFLKSFRFRAEAGYKNYKDLYFFVNNTVDSTRFDVVYDDGNVTQLELTGEVEYNLKNSLSVALRASYFGYSTSQLLEPWHKPSTLINVLGTYKLNDKVFINADIYYIGGIRAIGVSTGETVSLKSIADLNLKVEYKLNKKLSFFGEGNNLASMQYQRYQHYPSRGLNFLLGLTYSF